MDISVIITCHIEGLILKRTIQMLRRTLTFAADREVQCEVILVCDNGDTTTNEVVAQATHELRPFSVVILETQAGDAGSARNRGIQAARGKYISILDGDDIYSENWLFECFQRYERDPQQKKIFHPEILLVFDRCYFWRRNVSMGTDKVDVRQLVYHCYWSALSFSRKELFAGVPYDPIERTSPYGFEDWHWNCEAVSAGWFHETVQNTCHFVRLKRVGSRNIAQMDAKSCLKPSSLFQRQDIFSLSGEEQRQIDEGTLEDTSKVFFTKSLSNYLRESCFWFLKLFSYTVIYPLLNVIPKSWSSFVRKAMSRIKSAGVRPASEGGGFAPPPWVLEEASKLSKIEPALALDDATLNMIKVVEAVAPLKSPGIIFSQMLARTQRDRPRRMVLFGEEFSPRGTEPLLSVLGPSKTTLFLFLNPSNACTRWQQTQSLDGLSLMGSFSAYREHLSQPFLRLITQFEFEEVWFVDTTFGYHFVEDYGHFLQTRTKVYNVVTRPAMDTVFSAGRVINRDFAVSLLESYKHCIRLWVEGAPDKEVLEPYLGDGSKITILSSAHF